MFWSSIGEMIFVNIVVIIIFDVFLLVDEFCVVEVGFVERFVVNFVVIDDFYVYFVCKVIC